MTTLVLLRLDDLDMLEQIVRKFRSEGLGLFWAKIVLSKKETRKFFDDGTRQKEISPFVEAFTGPGVILLVLFGHDAVQKVLKLVGDVECPIKDTIRSAFIRRGIPTCHIHASTERTVRTQYAVAMSGASHNWAG